MTVSPENVQNVRIFMSFCGLHSVFKREPIIVELDEPIPPSVSHFHTQTYTPPHILILTLNHSLTVTLSHSQTHRHTHTHTYTLTPSSITYTLSHSLSHSLMCVFLFLSRGSDTYIHSETNHLPCCLNPTWCGGGPLWPPHFKNCRHSKF